MAFADDVVLNDGTSNFTYSMVSLVAGKSIRKDASQDLNTPGILTISHQVNGTGSAAVARRMVRVDKTIEDGSSGDIATISAHIVLTVPNNVITKADVTAEVTKLTGFLGGAGNLDKLLNGEP